MVRTTRVLALALTDNSAPDRAVDLLAPLVDGKHDLSSSKELARAAALYPRALMLSRRTGVLEAADEALSATERLGLTPEIVDVLITKATELGYAGRLTEARVILEGAIAMADQHKLLNSLTRAQNNLAYVQDGIDDSAAADLVEDAYRSAQRLGDRSALLFATVRMAGSQVWRGKFDEAEELLASPMAADPPPAFGVWIALTRMIMCQWLGDVETVDRLDLEIDLLLKDVDDPQTRTAADLKKPFVDLAHDRLEEAYAALVDLLGKDWDEVTGMVSPSVFVMGLFGEPGRCSEIAERLEKYQPRFTPELTVARAGATAEHGPVDPREIDAALAKGEETGAICQVVMLSVGAANFVRPETKAAYLSNARSICEAHGWLGILGLLHSHFD